MENIEIADNATTVLHCTPPTCGACHVRVLHGKRTIERSLTKTLPVRAPTHTVAEGDRGIIGKHGNMVNEGSVHTIIAW